MAVFLRCLEYYPYRFRMNLEDPECVFSHLHQLLFPKIMFRSQDNTRTVPKSKGHEDSTQALFLEKGDL